MIFFIIGIVLVLIGIILFVACKMKDGPLSLGIVPTLLGILLIGASCIYAQDVGQTILLRNFGGSLGSVSTDAGFHVKAPWQDTIAYDVRNNVLSFMGDQEKDQFEGGSANGSAVTVNDSGGASATIDIQVNYSLDPNAAKELYSNYGSQENFVKSVCAVDIRAVPRQVSGQFDTISILTARSEFANAVQEALAAKWENYGLVVESVSIQNVVYPQNIIDKYSEAQAAEIAKETALNNQEVAKVNAETKVIESQGTADANKVLAESLTDEVLQQHYIDAIAKAENVYVVPSDSTPVITTNK